MVNLKKQSQSRAGLSRAKSRECPRHARAGRPRHKTKPVGRRGPLQAEAGAVTVCRQQLDFDERTLLVKRREFLKMAAAGVLAGAGGVSVAGVPPANRGRDARDTSKPN
ncbi:MAG: twin-arginine translocation signal domain-containing protein, partial [Planctomycetota bacterium]